MPTEGKGATMSTEVMDAADAFDLDVSIVEGSDEVDVLVMSTDNGCSSTCPNACSNSGVAQVC
jgi:FxLD family lantipeptide